MRTPRVVIQVTPASPERGVFFDAFVDGWSAASHAAAYAIAADASRVIAERDERTPELFSGLPTVAGLDLQPSSPRPSGFEGKRWVMRVRVHALEEHADLRAAFDRGATFECSRCGELAHGPAGHLSISESGERWMCPALQEQT